ncbi:MAG: MarR family winged helix-turn-helix transcriptional regulator [Propionibacteriaceae bacterium]|jgi:DNA-binding MarR family transcriptional regulator|nr:MarR family winged helix-turn-helix transcriptional regulator [Propionibacteriaceae bacterium]
MRQVIPTLGDERDGVLREIFVIDDEVKRQMGKLWPVEFGLEMTMQQVRVITVVGNKPGMSTHELSAALGVSAPTTSGLVDRLCDKGFVERFFDPDDRRVRRLRLSAEGERVFSEMGSILQRVLLKVVSFMSVDDLKLVKRCSEALLAAITKAGDESV